MFQFLGPTSVHLHHELALLLCMSIFTASTLSSLYRHSFGSTLGDYYIIGISTLWQSRHLITRILSTNDYSLYRSTIPNSGGGTGGMGSRKPVRYRGTPVSGVAALVRGLERFFTRLTEFLCSLLCALLSTFGYIASVYGSAGQTSAVSHSLSSIWSFLLRRYCTPVHRVLAWIWEEGLVGPSVRLWEFVGVHLAESGIDGVAGVGGEYLAAFWNAVEGLLNELGFGGGSQVHSPVDSGGGRRRSSTATTERTVNNNRSSTNHSSPYNYLNGDANHNNLQNLPPIYHATLAILTKLTHRIKALCRTYSPPVQLILALSTLMACLACLTSIHSGTTVGPFGMNGGLGATLHSSSISFGHGGGGHNHNHNHPFGHGSNGVTPPRAYGAPSRSGYPEEDTRNPLVDAFAIGDGKPKIFTYWMCLVCVTTLLALVMYGRILMPIPDFVLVPGADSIDLFSTGVGDGGKSGGGAHDGSHHHSSGDTKSKSKKRSIPWAEKYYSVTNEHRFLFHSKFILIRILENIFVTAICPQTAFACQVSGHCEREPVIWDRWGSGLENNDKLHSMFDSIAIDTCARMGLVFSVSIVTLVLCLGQIVVLDRSKLSALSYSEGVGGGGYYLTLADHTNHGVTNGESANPTSGRVANHPSLGGNRRYGRGVGNNPAAAPPTKSTHSSFPPNGGNSVFADVFHLLDVAIKSGIGTFQFELGHPSTSSVMSFASKLHVWHVLVSSVGTGLYYHLGYDYTGMGLALLGNLVAAYAVTHIGLLDYEELHTLGMEVFSVTDVPPNFDTAGDLEGSTFVDASDA
eukprot:CAMPEP_0194369980 /NCGR_PEP_ID=MMETSP0174-20130528/18355_1 /TAXON_ID=216777 /ORGANISM="Proboscia alata, Strain PI-D3" /LENGTH=801 /DNA_ID=CAMNT_0039147253 /DNA_START=141 /DNA_END=2546 /DNA_ORIENTATION=-